MTLFDPMDCSPSGSSVHGNSPDKRWSGLPCPPPGDLPNPGIEPRCSALQTDSLPSEPPGKPVFILQGVLAKNLEEERENSFSSPTMTENHPQV